MDTFAIMNVNKNKSADNWAVNILFCFLKSCQNYSCTFNINNLKQNDSPFIGTFPFESIGKKVNE